jgi:hypothetical protein
MPRFLRDYGIELYLEFAAHVVGPMPLQVSQADIDLPHRKRTIGF